MFGMGSSFFADLQPTLSIDRGTLFVPMVSIVTVL